MVTKFGKTLRKERVERDWTLNDMAKELRISAAYLSHMEMGRRAIPEEIINKICILFSYYELKAARLRKQAEEAFSPETIKIHSKSLQDEDRDLAKMFARRFTGLSPDEKSKMFEILGGGEEEE